ncbi:MAG TPA: hypothetical protein VK815_07980 [Candidatus Acidoferrales bacterium]|jgi:hypothetical protein|nr:hypothetical protein [Candidatus Acidoferrales bacterium]
MATGKISRLPREIREQVNEKLDAGEPGNRLVAWLNELPAVKALLAAEFDGAAINEQNITNWKQGGFREWRMEREMRAFTQQPTGAAVVTPEQLATIVAVRYLAVVREWQQSPVPVERRWRLMRVILQDVLKLQRGEHREQRLELELEKLEFAKERFEAGHQTDVRRVMTAFLMAARQWPEVQEALAGAFRLLQERKGAEKEGNEGESGPIKVNQGEKNSKKEEMQTELEGCSPSGRDSQPQSACFAGRVCRSATNSTSHGLKRGYGSQERVAASSAVGEVRLDVDRTELGPIKVDQGEISKKIEDQNETESCPANRGDEPSPPRGMRVDENLAKLKSIKVNQGEIFICRTGRSRTRTRRRTNPISLQLRFPPQDCSRYTHNNALVAIH